MHKNYSSVHNRRQFLKTSLLGAATGLLGTGENFSLASTSGCPKPPTPKFGLVTYLWGRDWDLPALLKNCEITGVLGVELRTTHAHGVEPSLNSSERQEVRKQFEDSPAVLLGPGSNERFDSPDPDQLAASIQATKDFIQLSADVGGTGVKVKPDSFHPNVPREKTLEQIGKTLHQLGRFSADLGQEIRVEVHGQCSPPPYMAKIMEIADHPQVRICWNSNQQDLEGAGLETHFKMLRPWFGDTAHVRELNEGTYPYRNLINMMVKSQYTGWVLLEARGNPVNRLRALIEQRHLFEEMVSDAVLF